MDTEKIIEEIRKMEKEMKDLKHKKALAETFLALVVKKVGPIEFNYTELFQSDGKKKSSEMIMNNQKRH